MSRIRTIAGVLIASTLLVVLTGLLMSFPAWASPASHACQWEYGHNPGQASHWARICQASQPPQFPASLPVLRTSSWATLTGWCREHGTAICDVLPVAARRDEHLGSRPARMIVSADGGTVFIVGDFHGHVRVVDES